MLGQRLQEPGAPARAVWWKAVNKHCKALKHNDLDFSPWANAYHMPPTSLPTAHTPRKRRMTCWMRGCKKSTRALIWC